MADFAILGERRLKRPDHGISPSRKIPKACCHSGNEDGGAAGLMQRNFQTLSEFLFGKTPDQGIPTFLQSAIPVWSSGQDALP
jgi:hypothetical protein